VTLDFHAIRLSTRRQQGLDDDLSVDIVDDVVRLTRSAQITQPFSLEDSLKAQDRLAQVNAATAPTS